MTLAVSAVNGDYTAKAVKREEGEEKKATITFQEWWNGEKSLTSTAARRVG